MNINDFKLKDATEITQGQLEEWQMTLTKIAGDESIASMNMSRYRRVMVQCSVDSGWFKSLPKGFKSSDLAGMKPGNVQAIADLVTKLYNEVTEPDEDFMSAPPTA